jgi:hypothetical protein
LAGAIIFVACLALGVAGQGLQVGQPLSIDVIDARPLAEAIRVLEERHGWIVTYEDARYEHESDIEDVTLTVRRDGKREPKVIVPKGGVLAFNYEFTGKGTPSEIEDVLEALIIAHQYSRNAGVFRLEQDGGIFHVVPAAVKDKTGNIVDQHSILETRITLAESERNILELLRAVLDAVDRGLGDTVGKIMLGASPLLTQVRVRERFVDESARDVIVRVLNATGRQYSWRLLYEPGIRSYALNLYEVTPAGSQ